MKILGIETSCDETAAGIVDEGAILSNVVRTQFELHGRYGGVVPELASRRHVEAVAPAVDEALRLANLTLNDLDGIAVTQGPGLVGALLIGLNFAKGLSIASGKPLVGVNHLFAHVAAGYLERDQIEFPMAAVVVSGGHTNLYVAHSPLKYELLGQTRDDAAGEAYDKVAKLLGLGYPGGKIIDDLAQEGDPGRFDLPRPMLGKGLDFSFSGLKTAVVNLVNGEFDCCRIPRDDLKDLAASFQAAVVDVITVKIRSMLKRVNVKGLVMAGGVAANRSLRKGVAGLAEEFGIPLLLPPIQLCTDNGAMVASLGCYYLKEGRVIDMDADAWSRWPLED